MLDFVVFSRLRRHPLAAAAEIHGRRREWKWIRGQFHEGVRNLERFRKDRVDRIGIDFAQLFHRNGDCRLPSHSVRTMATDVHEMRRIVSGRRIQVNCWKMGSAHSGRGAY